MSLSNVFMALVLEYIPSPDYKEMLIKNLYIFSGSVALTLAALLAAKVRATLPGGGHYLFSGAELFFIEVAMIQENGHSSLAGDIVEKIKNSILVENEFPPKAKLPNERLLAERFGVGRSSVREAIKALAADGLVVVKHGSGTFVSAQPGLRPDPLGFESIKDIAAMFQEWYEVRAILESGAMRMIVECAGDEEIEEIAALAEREREMIKIDDPTYLNMDRDFHLAMAKATHNTIMGKLIQSMQQSFFHKIAELGDFIDWQVELRANAMKYHSLIVEALKLRDADSAVVAMRGHMLSARRTLDTLLGSSKRSR